MAGFNFGSGDNNMGVEKDKMSLYDYYLQNVDGRIAMWVERRGSEEYLKITVASGDEADREYCVRVSYAKKVAAERFFGGIL